MKDRRWDPSNHLGSSVVGDKYRRDPDCRVGRGGGKTLSDLKLHHHEHLGDSRDVSEQVEDQRRGDVVGQVGDQLPRRVRRQHGIPVDLLGIALDDRDVASGDDLTKDRHQFGIHLHGGDRCVVFQQGEGQRAEARTDLDDRVTRSDPSQRGDPANRVGIDNKVLSERTTCFEAVTIEQRSNVGSTMGHDR